ncbi:hypothetical protein JCM3774_000295 [Rhodotorula dairenensis]
MPRPAASAIRRATTSATTSCAPASALCTCTCRPAPAQQPAVRQASTHAVSSAAAAVPAASAPSALATSPVEPTLHAGFGFFSRSLPKRKPPRPQNLDSTSSPRTNLQSTAAWILHAPPQFPVDLPMPSAFPYPVSGPPPPPPTPQALPFDVRNWSPSNSSAAATAATAGTSRAATPPSPATTLIGSGGARAKVAGPQKCVCGRVRMSCMRCRASSTAALAARAQPHPSSAAFERERAHDTDGDRVGLSQHDGAGQEGQDQTRRARSGKEPEVKKRVQRRRRDPNGPSDSPLDRLAALLREYSPKSLPHFRGVSVVASPHPPNRNSSRKLSLAEAEQAVSAFEQAGRDEAFLSALTVHETLDLVRAVSTVARAVQPFPPEELLPTTSTLSAAAASPSPDETARSRLRHRAARTMHRLLEQAGLDRISSVGTSALSGTRSSAALLVVDAACLAGDNVALSDSIIGADEGPASPLASALANLFQRESFETPLPVGSDKIASRQRNHAQNAHAALALVLEAFQHAPHADAAESRSSALAALRMMHNLGAESLLDFVQPEAPSASRGKQRAYNDVLRRKYGVILARLDPTPSRWYAEQVEPRAKVGGTEPELAALGQHLIRHLARTGSAREAFSVWQKLGAAREAGPPLRSRVSDLDRLGSLVSLVDGLAMDRLFADGNTLATELEDLARAVQIGGDGVGDAVPAEAEPVLTEPHPLVPEAYRALARLAAGQGRSAILDRVLGRLAAVSDDSAPVLEPAARQIRARSRRYELGKVRAIFDSAELDTASPEDRARLWGQLIAAHVRVNDVEGGLRALQEMLGTGLYVPLVTINVILHGFARRGDVKRAAELFGRLSEGEFPRLQPDTASWNALILAHVVARDPSAAEALIKEMRLSGARPDKQTWTTLLSAYVENAQWMAAFRVYRLLQSHPDPTFRPDTAVYNVMLKACILTGTPAPTVVELFRDLVARGVRPNMRTYTLVLQSVCIAGMMDVAEELFQLMDRRHDPPSRPPAMTVIEPDQFVYATLVAGYLRQGQPDKARAMLFEMNARGIRTSSIAVGIIISARIAALQHREGRVSAASMQRVIKQARDFLTDGANGEPGGLVARRRRQPVRFDRPLALGREAAVVYSPILRSLAKQGDLPAALELFDEILDRQDAHSAPPIELYTTLMDAFRVQVAELESSSAEGEEMTRSVYSIWHQLYDSVCKRFVRLRPVESLGEGAAQGGLPLPRFARRVDPAQAGLLRLPFTILLDTAMRLDDHEFIEATWRRLAQQGFAFDTSNLNALATWFVRDLQLEKAMWITEHVLCRPSVELEPDEQVTARFAAELASIQRADTPGRTPSRLWQTRQAEMPRSLDLSFLDDELAAPTRDEDDGGAADKHADVDQIGGSHSETSPTSEDHLPTALETARVRSAALATLPYRRTLEALGMALDHISVDATVRAEDHGTASPTGTDAAHPRAALVSFTLDEAQQFYHRLVRDHPRTIHAIETLRAHRRRAEMDRYERSKGRY